MLSFEPAKAKERASWALLPVGFLITAVSLAATLAAASFGASMSEHVLRRTDDGPLAGTGVLVATPDESRSPLGDDASAWVGAVGLWDRRQGERVFVPSCSVGRAYGVSLTLRDGLSLRLAFARPGDDIWPWEGAPGKGKVGLYLGPLSAEGAAPGLREVGALGIPEAVKGACAAAITKLGPDAVYRELTLKAEAEVSVFGCKRGNDLVPCGDGLDVVTVKSLDATRGALRGRLPILVALSALASLVALLALGARALSFVSRTRRNWK